MKVIGYIRVSTDKQELSPQAQQEIIQKAANNIGVQNVTWFEDTGQSGAKDHESRPGLSKALAHLTKGDILIVSKLDRLSRDLLNQMVIERIIERIGAQLISCAGEGTVDQGPAARLIRQIMGAFAEYERAIIRERTALARAVKVGRGEAIGPTPFGFRRSGKRLVPHSDEISVIEHVVSARQEGKSYQAICSTLNSDNVRTKRGKRWTITQVQRIVKRWAKAN